MFIKTDLNVNKAVNYLLIELNLMDNVNTDERCKKCNYFALEIKNFE